MACKQCALSYRSGNFKNLGRFISQSNPYLQFEYSQPGFSKWAQVNSEVFVQLFSFE